MSPSNEGSETPRPADVTRLQHPLAARLLDLFRSSDRGVLVGISLAVCGLPFVLGLAVAALGGLAGQYLTAGPVYVWTAGIFGGALTFGWWANRYPDLWATLRPTFDAFSPEIGVTSWRIVDGTSWTQHGLVGPRGVRTPVFV